MGKHFGELAFIRGLIYYKLSHHELKPHAGWVAGALNFIPRAQHRMWTWLPPFLTGYIVYSLVEWDHYRRSRKNPNDYVNEVDPDPPMVCKPEFEPPPTLKRDGPDGSKLKCPPKKNKD